MIPPHPIEEADQCPTSVLAERFTPSRIIHAFEAWIATRKAAQEAAFFLPHLRPGMQVLDVGWGPGSITLGLAEVVVPGEVVGVDLQESLVQRARELAVKRGVANVRFEVGDVYRPPFPPWDRTEKGL